MFTILIILIFKLPIELAVFVYIIINVSVNRFNSKELVPFLKTALEAGLLISTWLVVIFKEVLAVTEVIELLPELLSALPIPTFLVFTLILFFGTVVAGSQATIMLCMPTAMATVNNGATLSLFVLPMCINYVTMQTSPVHICLALCAENYRVPLSSMVAKTMPMVFVFIATSFLHHGLLRFAGL